MQHCGLAAEASGVDEVTYHMACRYPDGLGKYSFSGIFAYQVLIAVALWYIVDPSPNLKRHPHLAHHTNSTFALAQVDPPAAFRRDATCPETCTSCLTFNWLLILQNPF